jgi:hypothetical protein
MAYCVWHIAYGLLCMAYRVRLIVYGISCMAYRVWLIVYGISCMACCVWLIVYGISCMACCVWYIVYGISCVAYRAWHIVYGIFLSSRYLYCLFNSSLYYQTPVHTLGLSITCAYRPVAQIQSTLSELFAFEQLWLVSLSAGSEQTIKCCCCVYRVLVCRHLVHSLAATADHCYSEFPNNIFHVFSMIK